MSTPEALRDAGMTQAEDHADPRLVLMIDGAIAAANATGKPWSANDLRRRFPVVSPGLIGARVRAASMRKPREMRRVGDVASDLPSTHGKPIGLYVGEAS